MTARAKASSQRRRPPAAAAMQVTNNRSTSSSPSVRTRVDVLEPDVIAERLDLHERQVREAMGNTLRALFAVGERLAEARNEFGHGEWAAFVEKRLRMNRNTAWSLVVIASYEPFKELLDEVQHLPQDQRSLRELTRLDLGAFKGLLEDNNGDLSRMSRVEVLEEVGRRVRRPRSKGPAKSSGAIGATGRGAGEALDPAAFEAMFMALQREAATKPVAFLADVRGWASKLMNLCDTLISDRGASDGVAEAGAALAGEAPAVKADAYVAPKVPPALCTIAPVGVLHREGAQDVSAAPIGVFELVDGVGGPRRGPTIAFAPFIGFDGGNLFDAVLWKPGSLTAAGCSSNLDIAQVMNAWLAGAKAVDPDALQKLDQRLKDMASGPSPYVHLGLGHDAVGPLETGSGVNLAALEVIRRHRHVHAVVHTARVLPPAYVEALKRLSVHAELVSDIISPFDAHRAAFSPGAAPVEDLVDQMRRLRAAKVRVSVRVGPIAPGWTDLVGDDGQLDGPHVRAWRRLFDRFKELDSPGLERTTVRFVGRDELRVLDVLAMQAIDRGMLLRPEKLDRTLRSDEAKLRAWAASQWPAARAIMDARAHATPPVRDADPGEWSRLQPLIAAVMAAKPYEAEEAVHPRARASGRAIRLRTLPSKGRFVSVAPQPPGTTDKDAG